MLTKDKSELVNKEWIEAAWDALMQNRILTAALGEQDIMRATGLTQTPVRVTVNDLLDQNIIIKTEEKRNL